MMKSFVFLVVFLSTHFLVQGGVQPSSGSVCNCCDQCDQSATVSKLLMGISNMLVDDTLNATAEFTTSPTTTTTSNLPTTQNPTTTTTTQPSSPTHSSATANTSPVTDSSTKVESTTARTAAAVTDSYLTVNPLPTVSRSVKPAAVPSTTMSVCPDNCYLDISGQFCNCFLPADEVPN